MKDIEEFLLHLSRSIIFRVFGTQLLVSYGVKLCSKLVLQFPSNDKFFTLQWLAIIDQGDWPVRKYSHPYFYVLLNLDLRWKLILYLFWKPNYSSWYNKKTLSFVILLYTAGNAFILSSKPLSCIIHHVTNFIKAVFKFICIYFCPWTIYRGTAKLMRLIIHIIFGALKLKAIFIIEKFDTSVILCWGYSLRSFSFASSKLNLQFVVQ